jgi:hypothetical protein
MSAWRGRKELQSKARRRDFKRRPEIGLEGSQTSESNMSWEYEESQQLLGEK